MAERPAKVLVVSASLNTGGAQRVTSTLLEHLDRARVHASLALLRSDIGFPIPEHVPVHDLRYRGMLTFPATARRLRRLVEEQAPDVVLSNVNATNLIAGWAMGSRKAWSRWVARIGSDPDGHDRGLRRWVARRVYGRADLVVVNSRGLVEAARRRYPGQRQRIVTISNPTDFEAIDRLARVAGGPARRGGVPVLVAVGRLFRVKRYDIMLRAMALLRGERELELWICGDGPERGRLQGLSKRLGLEGSVRWLGFLPNPYAVMRSADLFLLTSDYEGLPNALIEAQGLGIPAVATRCPHGPDEIIDDGVTGVLVPVADADAVAQAVASILDEPGRRSRMGQAAAMTARARFDCATLVRQWEDLLVSLAADEDLPEGVSA